MELTTILTCLSLVLGAVAAIPVIQGIRHRRRTARYKEFLNELLLRIEAKKREQELIGEGLREAVKATVRRLSYKYFGSVQPPLPRDPVVREFFNRSFSFGLTCDFCRLKEQPTNEGCCRYCGLFCIFWAVGGPEDEPAQPLPFAKGKHRGNTN